MNYIIYSYLHIHLKLSTTQNIFPPKVQQLFLPSTLLNYKLHSILTQSNLPSHFRFGPITTLHSIKWKQHSKIFKSQSKWSPYNELPCHRVK